MIERVRDRATFDAFARQGKRARSGPLTVVHLPGGPSVRVAFAIGRKVGPAVVRNRLRRRLRELMRTFARNDDLMPGAYLIVTRPAAAELLYADLRRHLQTACQRVVE